MKKLLTACALILLTAPLHALVIETPLTFALKVQMETPETTQGETKTRGFYTRSFKTADIIQLIAEKADRSFTKKARLILRDTYNDTALVSSLYYITEPGQEDLLLTSYLNEATQTSVKKAKTSQSQGTGTENRLEVLSFNITINGETVGLYLKGLSKHNVKLVKTKTEPALLYELHTENIAIRGYSRLPNQAEQIRTGMVTGTIKYAAGKIIPPTPTD